MPDLKIMFAGDKDEADDLVSDTGPDRGSRPQDGRSVRRLAAVLALDLFVGVGKTSLTTATG